jgi:HK97 family phage portal protein
MGLLANKLGIKALSMEDPAQPLLPYSALIESLGLGRSDAGVMVNEKQAMRLTTAYACVMIISADLSSLPLITYQRMPDGSTREAFEHPYYRLLKDSPNPYMHSMGFRGALLAGALGWGNGYAMIRRNKGGRITSLQLLPSDKTTPVLYKGDLWYATTATDDGMPSYIKPENIIHIKGLSTDGYVGLSPIQTCKNAFGLAIAAEKFGAQFFGNGARTTGVLTHPGQLGTEAYENLKKSLREQMTGESALRPLLLEEGMSWNQTSVNPNDSQFLQTRQFQRSEIAALYRMPMHLLQDLQRATNNNIEHQALDYIRYTLRPWAIGMEQEFNCKMLGFDSGFYVEHDMNAFQRGDFASQTAGFNILRNMGVYSANDVLKVMRQNPIPEEDGGDVRIVPLNMVPLTSLLVEKSAEPNAPTTDSNGGEVITDARRGPVVNAFRRLFRDAVGRTVKRSNADQKWIAQTFTPILTSMAQTMLTVHLGIAARLTEQDESKVHARAFAIAVETLGWTAANASEVATRLTDESYTALLAALTGTK